MVNRKGMLDRGEKTLTETLYIQRMNKISGTGHGAIQRRNSKRI